MKRNEIVRIGIVGFGRMAQRIHVDNIKNLYNTEIVAVCDSDERLIRQLKESRIGAETFNDYRKMLAEQSINAVVITTPPSTHFAIVRDALRSGKHVFVEKPLALSTKEIFELRAEAHDAQAICMVGFMRRFDPALIWGHSLVKERRLGRIISIDATYSHTRAYPVYLSSTDRGIIGSFSPSPSLSSDLHGFLLNHLVHTSDLLNWFGGRVVAVRADSKFESEFYLLEVSLEFEGGHLGHLRFIGLLGSEWHETLTVYGTSATFFAKMAFPYLDTATEVSLQSEKQVTSPFPLPNTMYYDELDYFITNVRQGNWEVKPGITEALNAQNLIEGIENSIKERKRVELEDVI